ncbi:hypothetical protein QUF82_21890 [Thiotrichales bacterium HSG14]|nr:hypothetical protein [Thiotrichales bacterium HSG14]
MHSSLEAICVTSVNLPMLRTALPKMNIGVQNLFRVGKMNFALQFESYLRNISYL